MAVPSRRVVIVGAGYAGLGTAVRLARRADPRLSVELVDGRAQHQLITRLHEVAAGRLAPSAASVPLTDVLGGTAVGLRQAWVESVDLQAGRIETSSGRLEYDTLVLAPGSKTDVRGVPGATEHALPLRTLDEAVQVRATLLRRLEGAASLSGAERRCSLKVLVVGGGYTGVELAAELATWLPRAARRYGLGAAEPRVGLIEATERILPGHDGWMARRAADGLVQLGVQLFVSSPVLEVDPAGVRLGGGRIRARTVIWTTGVRAPRWLAESGFEVGRAGRAVVDAHLAAIGHPEVLVLGDAALARGPSGVELPPSAQVAVQQADAAAGNLAAALVGRAPESFVPYLLGEALSLGPDRGLARVGGLPLVNRPALLVKQLAQARYLEGLGGPGLQLRRWARRCTAEWCTKPHYADRRPPLRAHRTAS